MHGSNLQYSRAAAEEMSSVVVGVEADQITVEHAHENIVSDWKDAVYLAGREGSVQEEANLDILLWVFGLLEKLTKHRWHEHQMIILDPHHIIVLNILGDFFCKQAIGLGIGMPGRLVKGDFAGMVVKERPEDLIEREVRSGRQGFPIW
jgi:hypothetical protein